MTPSETTASKHASENGSVIAVARTKPALGARLRARANEAALMSTAVTSMPSAARYIVPRPGPQPISATAIGRRK